MRRVKQQCELQPVYVRPEFERREREASRDFREVAYSGKRARGRLTAGTDPLWLRLGMRASYVGQRAGWVLSSPQYDALLRRAPALDPSLPGPGWLREVYLANRDVVALPSAREAMDARLAVRRQREAPPRHLATTVPASPEPVQADLFGQEG